MSSFAKSLCHIVLLIPIIGGLDLAVGDIFGDENGVLGILAFIQQGTDSVVSTLDLHRITTPIVITLWGVAGLTYILFNLFGTAKK